MFVSVDLPMPGEPPSSTSEPGTMPPPRTRSNSLMPVSIRGTGAVSTSASRRGLPAFALRARPPPDAAAGAPTASSTIVFHALQPGHLPCQRGVSWPQAEQTWMVVGRAMSGRLRSGPDGPGQAVII